MPNAPAHVSDAEFEAEVLKASGPVIVDFWAEWCGPCKQIAPVLDELASEMGDKVKITKMNVDENMNTPGKYGIRAIPTLLMFKDGEEVDRHQGSATKKKLEDWIKSQM